MLSYESRVYEHGVKKLQAPHLPAAAAADPWLSVLPGGERATLARQLDAAATARDE
jgi:hypothetical protein